jgi:uncharacterized protein YndB with AHSA1/START domain
MKKRMLLLITGLVVMLSALMAGFTPRLVEDPPVEGKSEIVTHEQQHFTPIKMISDTTKIRNLTVTRVFEAPVATVWKAWSDSEHVMRWWGPSGFTSPVARMDFREGGKSLVCMRAPKEFGGQDMYNTWTYRKIVPLQIIEFILHFSDKDSNKLDPAKMGLPPGIPQDVPHVITFKSIDGGKTEMTITEYGYTTDQAHDLSKAGLEQSLDKMAASFKAAAQ